MTFSSFLNATQGDIEQLFLTTFTQSDGLQEGQMVSNVVRTLMQTTPAKELQGMIATDGDTLCGSIFFSTLTFESNITAFLLSPVAVSTDYQGQGIGQQLINLGLAQLKDQGVDLVFTYGDPNYYAKVGFQPIAESRIKAPLPLSMPQGWLCQSLSNAYIPTLSETPRCVAAFNCPEIW